MQSSEFEHQSFIGRSFGDFQILSYLGATPLYHAFKAFALDNKKVVNLKVFSGLTSLQENDSLLVTGQLRKYSVLRHPNIVQLMAFDSYHGYLYSVAEYIDGITLKTAMSREAFINSIPDLSLSLRIVYSMALALAYAHQRSVTHGSICPTCVMLEESGRIALTDFGFGDLLVRMNGHKMDRKNDFLNYASPEKLAGDPPDVQTDIYSLGAMFFHLVTGHLPVTEGGKQPHPRGWVPDIPDSVENVILKCIHNDQAQRYQSMANVIGDITKIRLQDKTVNLPTANLTELAEDSDKIPTWEPAERSAGKNQPQVCLHFVDTGQILNLEPGREYVIGRKHQTQSINPDIDLSPYSSYEWGISRLHAKLNTEGGKAVITDIGSSNGTWYAGKRMEANQPREFQHGDVVFIGKLKIQILMYS